MQEDDTCTDDDCGVSLRQLRVLTQTSEAYDPRCAAHADCLALSGDCCPTASNVMLACCKASPHTAPPAAARVLGVQASRLRITNGCPREPMWVAHMAGPGMAPNTPQNVQVPPLGSFDFPVSAYGLSSARYWPKFGCDAAGNRCRVGESGGPGQTCNPETGCAPPVDSKFEATFGSVGAACDTANGLIAGCDWLDVSMVDGYTVPFKVDVVGDCGPNKGVDCSHLLSQECPASEQLGVAGRQDLRVFRPGTTEFAGCSSPCAKLTYSNWRNPFSHSPRDPAAQMFCCPTPPVSPAQCSAGPVVQTTYVRNVHASCPGVYAYAYDDRVGLSVCPSDVKEPPDPGTQQSL